MRKNIRYSMGRPYRKLEQHEVIKPDDLHSWRGGPLFPLAHPDSAGYTPSDFSEEREFYTLATGFHTCLCGEKIPVDDIACPSCLKDKDTVADLLDSERF